MQQMELIGGFIIENAIGNTIPILISIGIFATVFDVLIKALRASTRALIYSLVGTAGGLSAYVVYDIPDRQIEVLEGAILGSGMYVYTLLICSLFFLVRFAKQNVGWKAIPMVILRGVLKQKPVQIGALTVLGAYLMVASYIPGGSSSGGRGRGGNSSWGASVDELPFALGVLAVVIAWMIYKKWTTEMGMRSTYLPNQEESNEQNEYGK